MEKAFNVKELVRKHLIHLNPYSSARDEFKRKADIMLDANESPFENNINRYPDPLQLELKQQLSRIKKVPADNIFLGNGSDEPIDLLIRAFCEPNQDNILITPPTYGMYKVAAEINNVSILECPLNKDFHLNEEELTDTISTAKLTFLCSPNNPSGNTLDLNNLKKWCTLSNGIVIVDEAYIDFCPEKSVVQKVLDIPNLVVLQTFSKALGAAGIRLGMAFTNAEILNILNSIKPPYNINQLTINRGLEILENIGELREKAVLLTKERNKLFNQLKELPFIDHVFPSDANFLLIRSKNHNKLLLYLSQKGIIVRDRSTLKNCDNCLRISVGTPKENKTLITTLKAYHSS